MATAVVSFLLLVSTKGQTNTTSNPSTEPTLEPTDDSTPSPTYKQLTCFSSENSTTTCSAYCSQTTIQTIAIGIEDQSCEHSHSSGEHHSGCIAEEIGCSIPWLCDLIHHHEPNTNHQNNSCSTANLLFNAYSLECDLVDHAHSDIPATTIQYTQFKLTQYCCSTNECQIDDEPDTTWFVYISISDRTSSHAKFV